jgi:hypothetical protein
MGSTVHTDGKLSEVDSTHETLADAIKKAAQLVAGGKTSVQIMIRENVPDDRPATEKSDRAPHSQD